MAPAASKSRPHANEVLPVDSPNSLHKLAEVVDLILKTTASVEFVHGKEQQPHKSVESSKKSTEEPGGAKVQHRDHGCYKGNPDKLLILRDVMQESMKDHDKLIQNNNEERDPQQELEQKKKKQAKQGKKSLLSFRARQKQWLALRNKSCASVSGMVDAWFEEELDTLWMGVRRHGHGNWEAMLTDPMLYFSKHKTLEDLSIRWQKERHKILNIDDLIHKSTSLLSSTFEGLMPQTSKGKTCIDHITKKSQPSKFHRHLSDGQLSFGDASDRSLVLQDSIPPLKSETSTSHMSAGSSKFQEFVIARERQSQISLEPAVYHKKSYRFQVPLQASQTIAEVCKNFNTEFPSFKPGFSSLYFKNQLPLCRKKRTRQNLLLGGRFKLPKIKIDWNGSDDSSETDSDSSMMERPKQRELSSEGTVSD